MKRATDDHIIKLFRSLPDEKQGFHSHPGRSSLVGGIREASMAFGELAKRHPERVKKLLGRLSLSTHQVPVGSALRALAEAKVIDPLEVLQLIDDAIGRGFSDKSFRYDVIWALHHLSDRLPGLEDRWVELLLSWMEPCDKIDAKSALLDPARGSKKEVLPLTVLFEGGRLRSMTGGENSTILRVCTFALLKRTPRNYARWLDILEKYVDRSDYGAVWGDLSPWLNQLAWADRSRASAFLSNLMQHQPDFRDSEDGARLIAKLLRVIPPAIIDEVLDKWRLSDWPLASIAIGEIEALRAAFFDAQRDVGTWIDVASGCPVPADVLAGVANVAVAFWNEVEAAPRMWSRRTLAVLAASHEPRVAQACVDLFRRFSPWPTEEDTRQLLKIFASNPVALYFTSDALADDRLSDLLEDPLSHEAILYFMEESIKIHERGLGDHSGTGPMLARGFIPIVLTLHREKEFRKRTLILFEEILDALPDETESLLKELH